MKMNLNELKSLVRKILKEESMGFEQISSFLDQYLEANSNMPKEQALNKFEEIVNYSIKLIRNDIQMKKGKFTDESGEDTYTGKLY